MENKKEHKTLKLICAIVALIIVIAIIVVLCVGYYKKKTVNLPNPIATMEVEGYGTIKIELYYDKAPNTVKNFVKLANNGYYNGLKFHRVIKEFMIQGGDSQGDGTGNVQLNDLYKNGDEKEYCIKGEMYDNGFTKNDLNLTEGVIAMARGDYTQQFPNLKEESYNSAGSQFFIMTTNDYTSLSGRYAGFGKVIEGMDVVKKIAEVEVEAKKDENESEEDASDKEISTPKKDVKIKTLSVETNGADYGYPETIEPFNYMEWLYKQYGIESN